MRSIDEFLIRHVEISTKTGDFKGILINHDGNEESLLSWGHFAHCLLSTHEGIIEILDKDIMCICEAIGRM